MAVNFPNNPQVGETYTLGSRTWQWSGTFWRAVSTTVGYTGSQGGGFNFLGTVATEQDLPLPYSGEESDAYVVAATGILWIWDGSSWGPVGQFTGYTGSRGTPGASVRIVGSVADQSLLPTPYGGNIGDGYLLADTGHLWTWDGTAWNDIGKLAGDVGATGFTGSIGFTGSTGYTGSVGESTFTWGDTAPENPAIGDRWFDTVVGAVTVYVDDGDSQAWLEVAGSGFMGQTGYTGSGSGSGPKVSGIDYPGDATAADPAGGETLGIQGSGFESGAHVLLDNQAVGQVVFVSATRLEFVAPSKTEGTYAYLYVINPDGGVAIHVPGVQYSGAPSWSTPAAGNLGSVYETQSINQSFAAVSDSSVTYSLASGTLPAGSTLDPATGVLSGTAGLIDNATTYTFIIRATDAESQTADRQFSLTIDPDTMTWSFPSEGAVIEIPQDEASTTTFSASAATGNAVTYSVSALPDGLALSGATVSGTATTLGDTAATATATASSTAAAASVSLTWRVVLGGDLYFNQTTLLLNADDNTFITDASDNAFTITPVADTRPSAFSPYNTSWSNFFDGNGDSLTVGPSAEFTFSTGDWTVEYWVYLPAWTGLNTLVNISNSSNPDTPYGFIIRSSGTVGQWVIYIGDGATWAVAGPSTTTGPGAGVWQHHAHVRSSGTYTMYIDGVSRYSVANSTDLPYTYAHIGRYTYFATGYLSNFRVVKGTAVYTAAFTPPTAPLTAISGTSLLTCQSNRFRDASTNNFTITKNGDVKVTAFAPFTDTDTSTGSGYFDGTGDYLTVASGDPILPTGTQDYAVEAWVYWGTQATSFPQFVANPTNNGFQLYYDVSGGLLAVGKFNVGSVITYSIAQTALAGQWTHVLATRSGNTHRLFLNGVLRANGVDSHSFAALTTQSIGSGGAANYIVGYLSGVRSTLGSIPTTYQTASTTNGTAVFTPPTAPLTAVSGTSLLTLQNRVSYNNSQPIDESGIRNIITRVGNASAGTFSPHVPTGWSAYFDGTDDYLTLAANSAFNLGLSGEFCIELWFFPTAISGNRGIIGNYRVISYPGNTNGFDILWGGTVAFRWGYPAYADSGGSPAVALNTWNHVVVCRDTSPRMSCYLNGTRWFTTTTNTGISDSSLSSFWVGWAGSSSGTSIPPFPGYISNARILKGSTPYDPSQTTIAIPTAPLEPIAGTSLLTLRGPGFTDDGPNRFAITRNGDTRITPFSPFAPHTRAPDSHSVYFDGTGDYLSATGGAATQMSTGAFTWECWCYITSTAAYQCFIDTRPVPTSGSSTGMGFILSTGTLTPIATTTDTILTSSINVTLNAWTHVALTRTSGGTLTIWVNGQSGGSVSNSSNLTDTALFVGGNSSSPHSAFVNGYLSNLRIVKGTAIDFAATGVPTAPLTAIANTSLLTCQSPTVIDNSDNAFALTVNGNTQPTQFNPFGETVSEGVEYAPASHGGSVYFDGTGDYLAVSNFGHVGAGDYTIECWVYLPLTGFRYIFDIRPAGQALGAFINSNTLYIHNASSLDQIVSTNFVLNTWNHFAYVRSGSGSNNTSIYLNGNLINQRTNTTNFSTSATLYIGTDNVGNYSNGGYVSNFRIVKGTAVYTSAFVPPAAPADPISGTTLLINGTNAAIQDKTGRTVLETVGNARTLPESPYRLNKSVYFDGTGDYLITVNADTVNAMGSGNWTVEAWVYRTSSAADAFVFDTVAAGSGAVVGMRIMIDASSKLVLKHYSTAVLTSTGTVPLNQWTHIAIVKNSGTTTGYINGVADGTYADSSTYICGTSRPAIGADGFSTVQPTFPGYISNLRAVKGIAVYTGNFTPPTAPLEATQSAGTNIAAITGTSTSLLTCQSYNFKDNSTNNFTITRNGDAKVTSRGPFTETETENNAMYFDGSGDYLQSPNSMDFNYGSGNFTIEFWMYAAAQAIAPICHQTSLASNLGWVIWNYNGVSGTTITRLLTFMANGGSFVLTSTSDGYVDNTWTHIAVVKNGTGSNNIKIYSNGTAIATGTYATALTNATQPFYIGGIINGVSWNQTAYFNGLIDDLRITRGVARYTANFTPPTITFKLK